MSCCLYWVILEERLSLRVLASAVDDSSSTALARTIIINSVLFLDGISVPECVSIRSFETLYGTLKYGQI